MNNRKQSSGIGSGIAPKAFGAVRRASRPRSQRAPVKQPTPDELIQTLSAFIQRHFYPAQPIEFAKDRPRLLKWVILKFATWLEERGVTLPPARYQEIMQQVLMDALRFGSPAQYIPAWLGKVIESHLAHHGEDYYEEAKLLRNRLGSVLALAAGLPIHQPDPVRELAHAARLVKTKKRGQKPPSKAQLNLL